MQHQHRNDNQQTGTIYTCSMHPEIRQDKPGNCPICGMNLVAVEKPATESQKEVYVTTIADTSITQQQFQKYTCSMHPHILMDAPGKYPLCGMTLEPLTKSN
jgi:rubrerythrin